MNPSVGRIVHYVMADGQHRPAIIVRVWTAGNDPLQLQVFTDGANDGSENAGGIVWKTSVRHSETPEPNTWHWPERD